LLAMGYMPREECWRRGSWRTGRSWLASLSIGQCANACSVRCCWR
jgi:hypothetical protein